MTARQAPSGRPLRLSRLLPVPALLVAVGALALVGGARGGGSAAPAAPETARTGTIAYYFHGEFRCGTCRTIETRAEAAIRQGFPKALASGSLVWQPLNIDEPQHTHFVQDFQLVTRSLVLVDYQDGNVAHWENLDQVWTLVWDEDRFSEYVQGATRRFLARR